MLCTASLEQFVSHPVTNVRNVKPTLAALAEAGVPLPRAGFLFQQVRRYQV